MLVPYAKRTGDIRDDHLDLFQMVVGLLESPDVKENATCHEICEYLSYCIPETEHIKGYFARQGCDHSWLGIRGTLVVIDAYPVAGALQISPLG